MVFSRHVGSLLAEAKQVMVWSVLGVGEFIVCYIMVKMAQILNSKYLGKPNCLSSLLGKHWKDLNRFGSWDLQRPQNALSMKSVY